jgi:quercetin dioxygenase-like cupin family protein
MKKKHCTDVEGILSTKEGFKGMNQRFLWTKSDGCNNFAMRLMEFEPYGHTSYHTHLEDHEFFILEGEAIFIDAEGRESGHCVGDTIYIPPDESHQIKNASESPMKLLCLIPILPGGDGKTPAPRPDGQDYVIKERPM